LQHLQQCLLDQPIRDRREAKLALAAVWLRDRYPSYRSGPLPPRQPLFPNQWPRRHQLPGGLVNVQPIHARCAFVGFDAFPRLPQVLSRQDRLQQSRPCALGVPSRAGRFVADRITPGFTVRDARPARQRLLSGSWSKARSFAPRLLPTLARPHAVALRFVRRDQLTVGLSPTRVRPAGRTQKTLPPKGAEWHGKGSLAVP